MSNILHIRAKSLLLCHIINYVRTNGIELQCLVTTSDTNATEQIYVSWIQHFIRYHNFQPIEEMQPAPQQVIKTNFPHSTIEKNNAVQLLSTRSCAH